MIHSFCYQVVVANPWLENKEYIALSIQENMASQPAIPNNWKVRTFSFNSFTAIDVYRCHFNYNRSLAGRQWVNNGSIILLSLENKLEKTN